MQIKSCSGVFLLLTCVGCSGLAEFDALSPTGAGPLTEAAGMATIENPQLANVDVGRAVDAATDLGKAASLSEEEVKAIAKQFISHSDRTNRVAAPGSTYAARLERLTAKHRAEDGLSLDFKVYLSPQVNAFATADGSIRVYSGLMDMMSDAELRSVIGHEIGHVKLKHIDRATRVAYATSALRKGVASTGTVAAVLAESQIGGAFEKFLDAQFSQSQELDSDSYGLQFMLRHGYEPGAAISALRKLGATSEDSSLYEELLSSHPVSTTRVEALEVELAKVKRDGKEEVAAAEVRNEPTISPEAESDWSDIDRQVDAGDYAGPVQQASLKRLSVSDAAVKPAPRDAKGSWFVQLSAETEFSEAQDRVQLLIRQGFEAQWQAATVRGTKYYRVLAGPFASSEAAKRLLPELRQTAAADGEPFVRRLD